MQLFKCSKGADLGNSRKHHLCPFCGGASAAKLLASDYNRKVSSAVFCLRECGSCGLFFVENPPDNLGIYYDIGYHCIPKTKHELQVHRRQQLYKTNLLMRFCLGGRLLEIGPSNGQFCVLAQQEGFDVHAIEMDVDCASFLNHQLGVPTTQSADPASVLREQHQRYDAICLWHSLEHLPRFWETLEMAASRLNPCGVLVIAVPNPLSWQARLMGAIWPHHDLPRHLFGISMPWLRCWSDDYGLEVAFASTRDEGSIYFNRFSWAMLAIRLVRGAIPGGLLWRLGLLIGRLFSPLEDREGQGACYTMVLRRPST